MQNNPERYKSITADAADEKGIEIGRKGNNTRGVRKLWEAISIFSMFL